MTVLEEPLPGLESPPDPDRADGVDARRPRLGRRRRPVTSVVGPEQAEATGHLEPDGTGAEPEPSDHVPDAVVLPPEPRGMRISRVRLASVLQFAAVFFLLGYAVTIGTLVVLWNVALRLGFVADFEDLVETSLGLEAFDVVGRNLFDVAAVGLGIVFAIGLVITVLLALVYNAACALFGGLAVETGPLRRPRKVFSLRHRRFIDVR